jgi:hypothetical protein
MSKQKSKIENEAKDAKFRRIVNPRIKKLVYECQRITKMATQPTYTIYDIDAQKMLDYVTPELNALLETFGKIANGESLKTQTKKELKDVF